MEIIIEKLEKLEPIKLYLLLGLFIFSVMPFLILSMMFFAFMATLDGLDNLLKNDPKEHYAHIEPIRPWPRS